MPNNRPSGAAGAASGTSPTLEPHAITPAGESVGTGKPALGPTQAGKLSGAPFVLVKNWNFGAVGTIKDMQDLISEFQSHDQFNTIANGTNYGSGTVAATATFSNEQGKALTVTISCGVIACEGEDSLDVLVNRADEALEEAEDAGGNRVVVKI